MTSQSDYLDILPLLTPYQQEFLLHEYGRGEATYADRLKFIGLNNQQCILDAGGGIGQWAFALSRTCKDVHVFDIRSDRLLVGKLLADRLGINNISFCWGNIEALPYPDSTFDALICYGVFMFANGNLAAREFARVLKPGGKLYIMVDTWRWHTSKFLNLEHGFSGLLWLSKRLVKKALGKSVVTLYTPKSFESLLISSGFKIISSGQDGFASFVDVESLTSSSFSFYPSRQEGDEHLWEVCAKKL